MPPEVATDRQWAWVQDAIDQHQSALIRYAQSILHDGEQARDAVQETFIKLCKQQPQEVANHLAPWLFRVVRNQCLNILRKEKRMTHYDSPDAIDVQGNPAQSHPQEQRRKETITSLFELVNTLPHRQRELVLLKFQQDFSYQEISEVTGLTVSNVGYILHQAIRSLKEAWQTLETSNTGGQTS